MATKRKDRSNGSGGGGMLERQADDMAGYSVSPFDAVAGDGLNSPDIVTQIAIGDADHESMRFLADVVIEVPYSDFHSTLKLQKFIRYRRLAFMDSFEELSDPEKRAALIRIGGIESLSDIRKTEEYSRMRQMLALAADAIASGETSEEWIKRVRTRARRNLERFSRTADPENAKDASRAAAEILERDIPKVSREKPASGPVINNFFSGEVAANLVKAMQESGVALPADIDADESHE